MSPVAGNIDYNLKRITDEMAGAAEAGAHLIVFPELAIVGYPPKDLLEYPEFLATADKALVRIKALCEELGLAVIVGSVAANIFGGKKALCNAAIYLAPEAPGPVIVYKRLLPTYDVFDEQRYFQEAPPDHPSPLIQMRVPGEPPLMLGVSVCEDIWNDEEFWQSERRYAVDPQEMLVEAGAEVLINISSSPFTQGKPLRRLDMMRHIARRRQVPVVMVNQVGGNDQIVYDGGTCAVLPEGTISAAAGWFQEKTVIWDTAIGRSVVNLADLLEPVENNIRSILAALEMGLHDYMARTGFSQALVGNSGGIDSAVVLALAVKTLGPDRVISVTMPSQYTSSDTFDDAGLLAKNLGIRHIKVPIVDIHGDFRELLAGPESPVVETLFDGDASQMNAIAEENVQARIRANILMYISNAITTPRTLLLTTGNKSELAVGYCTLYGDMSGGLAILSDVPKMTVYKLARELNTVMGDVIPLSIIEREPSAELAPGQKDQDSLPPYPVLDEIIRLFVEEHKGSTDIVASGVADEAVVNRVVRLIENAEYKRAQAAPGIKITSKAFGSGRRVPIARQEPVF